MENEEKMNLDMLVIEKGRVWDLSKEPVDEFKSEYKSDYYQICRRVGQNTTSFVIPDYEFHDKYELYGKCRETGQEFYILRCDKDLGDYK